MSKAFLAASVGILMDDYATGRNVTPLPAGLARFDWDTKVADILPGEWELADSWASQKANMRDILAHVSGMPRCVIASWFHIRSKDICSSSEHLATTIRTGRKIHPEA